MLQKLKQQYIDAIYKEGSFYIKEEPFLLRSGKKSHIYLNHRSFLTKHKHLKLVANIFLFMLQEKSNNFTFAAVDSLMSPILAAILSYMMNKDILQIKEQKPDSVTKEKTYGKVIAGNEYVIIDDVVSTGSLIINASKEIKEKGGIVRCAIVCAVRDKNAIKEINDEGIEVLYIADFNEIISFLHPTLTEKEKELLSTMDKPESSYFDERLKLSYTERAELCTNPIAKKLCHIMEEKKTNLILAVDVNSATKFLDILKITGPYIAAVKTHIDIIDDFSEGMIDELKVLSNKYNFLIFEDRKFAEIGNTAKYQYSRGIYHIIDWAHIVNAHSVPGFGVMQGLEAATKEHTQERACILIAQMSSQDNLATREYSKKTIEIAEMFPEFNIGFIATGGNPLKLRSFAHIAPTKYLLFTPGVRLGAKADTMQQSYNTPEKAIKAGSDLIIVGRGVYETENIEEAAKMYRDAGWKAYEERRRI